MKASEFIFLSGNGNFELSEKTIRYINNSSGQSFQFSHIDFDNYTDGEPAFKIENPEKIQGKVLILFQSMFDLEKVEEFLALAFACKYQYKARHLIAVMPFMRYRRQENKDKHCEINRNLMLLKLMKAVGVDEAIFCDIHSETTLEDCCENGIVAHNVSSARIIAELLEPIITDKENVKIYSPDQGSIPRAITLKGFIKVPIIYNLKNRDALGVSQVADQDVITLINKKYGPDISFTEQENVHNQTIIMFEDEVATGSTAKMTGIRLKKMGAKELIFCATHPVCCDGWKRVFIDNSPFDRIILANTVPRGYEKSTGGKVINASVHPVIAIKLLNIMKNL